MTKKKCRYESRVFEQLCEAVLKQWQAATPRAAAPPASGERFFDLGHLKALECESQPKETRDPVIKQPLIETGRGGGECFSK
jgi:hypothetical protein